MSGFPSVVFSAVAECVRLVAPGRLWRWSNDPSAGPSLQLSASVVALWNLRTGLDLIHPGFLGSSVVAGWTTAEQQGSRSLGTKLRYPDSPKHNLQLVRSNLVVGG